VEVPSNENDEFASDGGAYADNDGDSGGSIRFLLATDRGGVDSDSTGHSTPPEETEEDAG
jgi:hypothetical protein